MMAQHGHVGISLQSDGGLMKSALEKIALKSDVEGREDCQAGRCSHGNLPTALQVLRSDDLLLGLVAASFTSLAICMGD